MRAIPAPALLLVLVLATTGPSRARATGTVPSVQLLVAPDPGDSVFYVVPFSWKGTDSDGVIDHYRVAIDPTPVDSFWFETTRTQQSFFFLSNQIQTPLPGSGPVYFFHPHTLAVEAVDNDGMASAPASRSFTSYTVAPEVLILSPVPNPLSYVFVSPNAVHIAWSGVDWDGVFSSRPVKYKYKLFSQNSFEISWSTILVNPDSLRRQYAPAFAGWDSTSADTGSVDYSNLIPNNQYLFCVVGFDEAGAYSPRFSIGGNMIWMQANDQVSVDPVALSAPRLEPPRPNPAGAIAAIDYVLPGEGPLDLEVFDAGGRRLRTLATGVAGAGVHRGAWDLRDDGGRRVTPGLYLVRLRTQGAMLTRKLVVVR